MQPCAAAQNDRSQSEHNRSGQRAPNAPSRPLRLRADSLHRITMDLAQALTAEDLAAVANLLDEQHRVSGETLDSMMAVLRRAGVVALARPRTTQCLFPLLRMLCSI